MLQHLCTCVEFKVPIHKHLDLYFFQTAVPWGYSSTAVLFSHSLGAVSVSSLTCWQWEQERGSIANSSIPISTLLEATQPDTIYQLPHVLSACCSCPFEAVI